MIVELCDDNNSIPRETFKFFLISEIKSLESDTIVDLIGVMTLISPTSFPVTKKYSYGFISQMRHLQLIDTSGQSIRLTLWGNLCDVEGQRLQNLYDDRTFLVLAAKYVKIHEKAKTVTTRISNQLFIEPNIPKAHSLRRWYERAKNVAIHPIS